MHDFKLVDYTTYFLTDSVGFNIFSIVMFTIVLFLLLMLVIFSNFNIKDGLKIKYGILLFLTSLGISIFIIHLISNDVKYDITYEAKAKVIDYQKNDIADDLNSNSKNNYIIIQMKDKKQKIYLNGDGEKKFNSYTVKKYSNIKKGDQIKIILHYKNNDNGYLKEKPKIGENDYLDAYKRNSSAKNKYDYIELKKI